VDFSIGSVHFKCSIAALAGVALGLLLFFRFGQGGSAALDRWLASGPQEIATHRRLLAQDAIHRAVASRQRRQLSDSLAAIVATARALQARSIELSSAAASAPQLREAARVLAQANQVCMDGLTLCQVRGDSLARADSAHTDSLRQALAAADAALQRGLEAASCHLIHIGPIRAFGCPSRATWFKVGIIGGVVVVEGLRVVFTGHF